MNVYRILAMDGFHPEPLEKNDVGVQDDRQRRSRELGSVQFRFKKINIFVDKRLQVWIDRRLGVLPGKK